MVLNPLKLILKNVLNMSHMHGTASQIQRLKIVGQKRLLYLIMVKEVIMKMTVKIMSTMLIYSLNWHV